MDASIPANTVSCFVAGFGLGGCSDSLAGGVTVGGLHGFGALRPDCACTWKQTIKTSKTLNKMFTPGPKNLVLTSFSPLKKLPFELTGAARILKQRLRMRARKSKYGPLQDFSQGLKSG